MIRNQEREAVGKKMLGRRRTGGSSSSDSKKRVQRSRWCRGGRGVYLFFILILFFCLFPQLCR